MSGRFIFDRRLEMLNAMLSQTAQGRHLVVVTTQEGFSMCSERLLGTSGSRVPATASTSDNHKPPLTLPTVAKVRRLRALA